jgi:hypothetical protein
MGGFKGFLAEYLRNRKPGEFVFRPKKTQGAWKYRYDVSGMVEGHFENLEVHCSWFSFSSMSTGDWSQVCHS